MKKMIFIPFKPRGGAMGQRVRPASGRLGVRNPAAICLSRKNRDIFTALRSAIGVRVTSPRRPYINGCPVSQYVWHAK